jgi:uncharacterized protein (DUF1501 family)
MSAPMTRRDVLRQGVCGFGAFALAGLLSDRTFASGIPGLSSGRAGLPHFAPKARSVIFLYMDGGPSQVDTFDPKPKLQVADGKPFAMNIEATQFDNNGNSLGSPWEFRRYGQSGIEVSDLFPHVGERADDLCVIRSMTSPFSEHTNANYFLHTGLGLAGRPSMGAWISYGLGSASQDLPGFVVINGGLVPPGGLECFGSGFLAATHQGSILRTGAEPVANINPMEPTPDLQRRKLDLIAQLDQGLTERLGRNDAIESAIENYELAFRMQTAVPELMDMSGETEETRSLYGLDSDFEPTRNYAMQCLIARRLVERGVRFIELTCPAISGNDRWDQHSNLRDSHASNAMAVDQPIGGLLTDLKRRGLLEDTLVIWGAEFGRTPFAQGTNGRDHNPFGFSIWLAGAGVRGGMTYGSTDEYGYKAVDKPVEIHDLHATMLHLLGVDHTRLTVPFGGREMRLTDVHGHLIHDILA